MIKRNKVKSRQLRKRGDAEEDAEADAPAVREGASDTSASTSKPLPPMTFNADETSGNEGGDNSAFVIKRSAAGKRMSKLKGRLFSATAASSQARREDDADNDILEPPASATLEAQSMDHAALGADIIPLDDTDPASIAQLRRLGLLDADTAMMMAMDDDNDPAAAAEEDEEVQRWEMAQIQRGGALHEASGMGEQATKALAAIKRTQANRRIPAIAPIPSFEVEWAATQATLQHMQAYYASHVAELDDVRKEIHRIETVEQTADADLTRASERYDFFQSVNVAVMDLVEFMDNKLERDWLASLQRTHQQDFDSAEFVDANSEQGLLIQQRNELFADAAEEYTNLATILARFETWKYRFAAEYTKMWTSDSLPYMVEMHVRYDLACWDPFKVIEPSLEERSWFDPIANYGTGAGVGTDNPDEDHQLLSRVLERYVIPRARQLIAVYCPIHVTPDPYPLDVFRRGVLEPALYAFERTNESFQILISAMVKSIHAVVIGIVTSTTAPTARRKLDMLNAVVANVGCVQRHLSRDQLFALAVDSLASYAYRPLLQSATITEYDVAAITQLAAMITITRETLDQHGVRLDPLIDCAATLANRVTADAQISPKATEALARLLRTVRKEDEVQRLIDMQNIGSSEI
ncbi:hypothetical protein RI367_006894 [Sorochytrium milnesiophthora]